jgi:hypothetical protein
MDICMSASNSTYSTLSILLKLGLVWLILKVTLILVVIKKRLFFDLFRGF